MPKKHEANKVNKGAAPTAFVNNAPSANNSGNSAKPWLFQKGQSGNPSGRPKGQTEMRKLAQEHTAAAIHKLVSIMNNEGAPYADQRGAAEQLLNRAWGKPLQQMEVGKPGDFAEMTDDEVDTAIDMLVTELSEARAFKKSHVVN